MNRLLLSAVCSISLVSLISCQSALAFNNAGTVSLNVAGGYDYLSSKRHDQNTGVGFGIVGYNLTDNWGLEGLFGFFSTKSRLPGIYNQQVKGKMFALDVAYHFSPFRNIQPYVLAGPGMLGFTPNGTDADYEGNINAAVGVQVFFTDIVALRLEARDFYTFVGGKNDVMLSGGVTFLIKT